VIALALVAIAELALWTVARFVPLPTAPVLGAGLPLAGSIAWLVAGIRSRPGLGETALAIDVEDGSETGCRVRSSWRSGSRTGAPADGRRRLGGGRGPGR
jgi:hypothetical protein